MPICRYKVFFIIVSILLAFSSFCYHLSLYFSPLYTIAKFSASCFSFPFFRFSITFFNFSSISFYLLFSFLFIFSTSSFFSMRPSNGAIGKLLMLVQSPQVRFNASPASSSSSSPSTSPFSFSSSSRLLPLPPPLPPPRPPPLRQPPND